jgi:hypothetical protein
MQWLARSSEEWCVRYAAEPKSLRVTIACAWVQRNHEPPAPPPPDFASARIVCGSRDAAAMARQLRLVRLCQHHWHFSQVPYVRELCTFDVSDANLRAPHPKHDLP